MMKSDSLPRYYADVCDNQDPEYSDYENFGKIYHICMFGFRDGIPKLYLSFDS